MPTALSHTGPDFEEMTMADLCAWYVENVGYDPVADDPKTELEELRARCRELADLYERERELDNPCIDQPTED